MEDADEEDESEDEQFLDGEFLLHEEDGGSSALSIHWDGDREKMKMRTQGRERKDQGEKMRMEKEWKDNEVEMKVGKVVIIWKSWSVQKVTKRFVGQ